MVIGMKKRLIAALLAGMMLVQTTACGNSTSGTVGTVDNTETMSESGTEADTEKEGDEVTALSLMQQVNTAEENVIDDNYRTYYEVFVYSFSEPVSQPQQPEPEDPAAEPAPKPESIAEKPRLLISVQSELFCESHEGKWSV